MTSNDPHRFTETHADIVRGRVISLAIFHMVCACSAGFLLMTVEPNNGVVWWSSSGYRGGGITGFLMALPATWPFILSFFIARTRVTKHQRDLVLYCLVVIAATAGGIGLELLGTLNGGNTMMTIFLTSMLQEMLFPVVARSIARLERDHKRET